MLISNSKQVFDFIDSHSYQKFISKNALYLARSGSKAYNTNVSSSDDDIKGITLAPKNYHYGFLNNFEQYEHSNPDIVVFSFQKYMKLALNNNPSVLETLFTDEQDILYANPAFNKILEIKSEILSKRCYHTFTGYARGQIRKCVLHKSFNDKNPVKPDPKDYGIIINDEYKSMYDIINSEIQKELDKSLFNDYQHQIEMTNKFYEVATQWKLSKEKIWESHLERFIGGEGELYKKLLSYKKYHKDLEEYKKYLDWQKNRNAARAKDEEESGFSRKYAYHVIRLLTMSKEILTQGKVIVKRVDDRDLYLDIRNGKYSFDEFMAMAKSLVEENDQAYKTSSLPNEPDFKKFDQIVVDICDSIL